MNDCLKGALQHSGSCHVPFVMVLDVPGWVRLSSHDREVSNRSSRISVRYVSLSV